MRGWKRRSSTTAFENARIRVLEDVVVQPDGRTSSYTVVEERYGAVVIVPVADDGRVVLTRQHRYPIDAVTLEVPSGEVPEGRSTIEQARRELAEETGIQAARLEELGVFAPWPARLRRRSLVVLATELNLSGMTIDGQAGDEAIQEIRLCSRKDLRDLIAAGVIMDGNTLSSLSLYWAMTGDVA
jgi:ADP-ribose pyrophosphatase